MKKPLQSELPQMESASRLAGRSGASVPRSVDTATLDLLSVWLREDLTSDSARLEAVTEARTAADDRMSESRASRPICAGATLEKSDQGNLRVR